MYFTEGGVDERKGSIQRVVVAVGIITTGGDFFFLGDFPPKMS